MKEQLSADKHQIRLLVASRRVKSSLQLRLASLDSSKRVRRQIAITLTAILVCGVLPLAKVSHAQKSEFKTEMAASKFPKLVSEYLNDLHARHPMQAAASGLHAWDGQLEDFSFQALSAEINAIKAFQSRLEKVPHLELRLSDTFDYQILASNMSARLLELEQIKSYERNPQVYNDPISTGLLQIAMFEYAPADSRIRHVIAKENLVPDLLA